MLARFSRISGDQSGDLAPIVPGLSRSESGAYEFLHSKRARVRESVLFPDPAGGSRRRLRAWPRAGQ
jgi:hypothetical protein